MIIRLGVVAAVLVAAGVANWLAWSAVQTPDLGLPSGPLPEGSVVGDWQLLINARQGADRSWDIPPELLALEGRTVTFDGVLFTMPQLVRAGLMEGAVLTPPSRFGCCGLGCDARPQLMMYLDLPVPQAAPTAKTTACRATGVLRLNRAGDSWTMSELTGAVLTWAP